MACGGPSEGTLRRSSVASDQGSGAAEAPATSDDPSGGTPAPACPTGLAVAKQVGAETGAEDLRLVGSSLVFRAGTNVVRVGVDGSARDVVYTSPDLVKAFADRISLLAIESPDPPNAVLRIVELPDAASGAGGSADPGAGTVKGAGIAVPTGLVAASTFVFGSDAAAFYLVSDGANGDAIYRFDRATLALTTLAEVEGVVSDPQLTTGGVWYVRDQKRVYMLDLGYVDPGDPTEGATPKEPAEMFGIGYDTCNLAVGSNHAYCSTTSQIEQRELTGGNPRTLLEADQTEVRSPFGTARSSGDAVVVRGATGDPALKDVIRIVGPTGDEELLACGRATVTAMTADEQHVAWAEAGGGVFVAPR
jgi:hypothetical protein